jgi:geranylgeranyl diphosphate synthase type II
MRVSSGVSEKLAHLEVLFDEKVKSYCGLSDVEDCSTPARKIIAESMLYSLNAGGKRLRPMLLLEMAKAYHGNMDIAMNFACAIEMIHTYSLIHDDLPCMDDDDLRRGKPTNHIVYGEDIAILAGDGLLNLSSELMMDTLIENNTSVRLPFAMREILNASGSSGMILGQVADIKYHEAAVDVERLDFINHYKTGKLITSALVSGAYLGDASDDEIILLREIGKEIGLLFQIVDDVLDVVGDPGKLGKRTQIDSKNDKTTYPNLIGMERTSETIEHIKANILKKVEKLSIDHTFLVSLVDFLAEREY